MQCLQMFATLQKVSRTRMLAILALMLLSTVSLFGQSTTTGAIGGTVLDPSNAVVPNATVLVHNNNTNAEQTLTTDATGSYRAVNLNPATYTVTITANGFAPLKAEQVVVTVGSMTTLSPHLKLGNASEQVEVSASTPIINTVSADFAPTLDETVIQNIPNNGGRWSSFTMLTPGVVSDSSGFGLVSFRGMSTLLNNVTIDGADNNQAYFSEERGRTRAGYSTAKVAIQEFQVNTSNYSSEYGRAAGGVVNTVTKSGGNQLHGELYWQDRNNEWGARNGYTTLTSPVYGNGTSAPPTDAVTAGYKPKDVRKIGGFGIGGAIIKDKLFWFLAYDRYHRNFPGTAVPNSAANFFAVPDLTPMTAGGAATTCGGYGNNAPATKDLSVCQFAALVNSTTHVLGSNNANKIPANVAAIDNTAYAAARTLWLNAMYGSGSQLGLVGITGSVPRKGDQNIIFPKLDWNINAKNHAVFEVNRMRWTSPAGVQTQATNNYAIASFGNDYVKTTWGVARLDSQIGSNMSNQLRFQYGRDFETQFSQAPTAYEKQTLINPVNAKTGVATGYSNPYGLPPNIYLGSFQWGTPLFLQRAAYPDEYKTQVADTMSWTVGKHNIKYGFDFMNTSEKINNLYQQYAEYSFSGLPQYFAQVYDPTHVYFSEFDQAFQGGDVKNPVQDYKFGTNDIALFVQDDYKLSRRLTVNLGLRYETETMPSPYANLSKEIALGGQTIRTGNLPNRPNSWGPRFGFAYDTFGDSKTVLRGGYGIFFGRIINSTIFSGMTNTGATAGQVGYKWTPAYGCELGKPTTQKTPVAGCGDWSANYPQIYAQSGSLPAGSLTVNYFDPKFTNPQIHEIDLTLQHEFGWGTVLSLSYLGNFGRHLQNFTDINMAKPGTPYCADSSGAMVAVYNGTCSKGSLVTPPSAIDYAVSNSRNGNKYADGVLPLQDGSSIKSVPFYTSRLNSNYGVITEIFSGVNSNYNALAVQLEKRMSNHVQFAVNYTWAHALDFGVNGTTGAGTNNLIDPLNMRYALYGNSAYNVPRRLTVNSVIDSPWKHTSFWKYLLDGWKASPVVQMQNGLGYSVTTASGTPVVYAGTQAYKGVSTGMLGSGGSFQIPGSQRNGFRQPPTYVVDLRLSKSATFAERYKFEFSAEAFNLLNHNNITGINTTAAYGISNPATPAAGTPSSTVALPTIAPNSSSSVYDTNGNPLFGVPSNGNSNFVYTPRQIQLGVKFSF